MTMFSAIQGLSAPEMSGHAGKGLTQTGAICVEALGIDS